MRGDRAIFTPTFEFLKVGFARFYLGFEELYGQFFEKWPKKVGFCPVSRTKSGQKISEAFSENGTFWAFFARFWPICANLGTDDHKKAHLPTFISYLIVIKSFNIYINKANKVGFWPRAISIAQKIGFVKRYLQIVLFFFRNLCYNVSATQFAREDYFLGESLVVWVHF